MARKPTASPQPSSRLLTQIMSSGFPRRHNRSPSGTARSSLVQAKTLCLEDITDLQRQMQGEPNFGVAKVDTEQILDPAESVEHRVAMEVQAVGRICWTAIGREVGPQRLEKHAAAVLCAQ